MLEFDHQSCAFAISVWQRDVFGNGIRKKTFESNDSGILAQWFERNVSKSVKKKKTTKDNTKKERE